MLSGVLLIEPYRRYPLCGHADELEDEGFDAAGFLQSEGFRVQPAHEELVEVCRAVIRCSFRLYK